MTRHSMSVGLGHGLTSPSVRARLVDDLRALGIQDQRVLDAMGRVPRHEFVDPSFRAEAYRNRPLPIGFGQTISQPWVVALMSEYATAGGRPRRVLEIGTGSGYQTAVLAELCETVFTLERVRGLSEQARPRLHRLGYRNIHFGYADGMVGWQPYAPYDAIVVTAGADDMPPALTAQLAPNGRLLIPVGPSGAQQLKQVTMTPQGLQEFTIADVSFVPLLGGRV